MLAPHTGVVDLAILIVPEVNTRQLRGTDLLGADMQWYIAAVAGREDAGVTNEAAAESGATAPNDAIAAGGDAKALDCFPIAAADSAAAAADDEVGARTACSNGFTIALLP